jgi:putative ABC transport system substrate-binding protein
MPRIGILTPAESDQTPIFQAFRRGLRERGYAIGRDILLEFRSAHGDSAALPKLAAELVRLPVDIILTDGAVAARAARDSTEQIPIIMGTTGADPVELGLVESLRHPGHNLTGFTLLHGPLSAKRLDLVRTAFPNANAVTLSF